METWGGVDLLRGQPEGSEPHRALRSVNEELHDHAFGVIRCYLRPPGTARKHEVTQAHVEVESTVVRCVTEPWRSSYYSSGVVDPRSDAQLGGWWIQLTHEPNGGLWPERVVRLGGFEGHSGGARAGDDVHVIGEAAKD